MSGGSYDYAYEKVESMAGQLTSRAERPLRCAFAAHLMLVARAMQAIEWVDSCDWGKGAEDEPIRACLAPGAEAEAALVALRKAMTEAQKVLDDSPQAQTQKAWAMRELGIDGTKVEGARDCFGYPVCVRCGQSVEDACTMSNVGPVCHRCLGVKAL